LGKLDLSIQHGLWQITTSNLRQIAFEKPVRLRWPDMVTVKIDGETFGSEDGLLKELLASGKLCKNEGKWRLCTVSGMLQRERRERG
jgi:hypothetical protein